MSRFLWMVGLLALWIAPVWAADDGEFTPDLSQARELIAGAVTNGPVKPTIPATDAMAGTTTLPADRPLELLTQVPNKKPRQVTPAPLQPVLWKYPLYLVAGLPRDMVDAVMGTLAYVPIANIPLVYVPYELVPTQFVIRDPRDWHKWPGQRNPRDHGMTDGTSWGWFPSAHTWHFKSPSLRKARRNAEYNEALRQELNTLNKEREERNQAIAARTQATRQQALSAIQAGQGRAAAQLMIPYHQAYPLDEGSYALFITALALYAPEGPAWVAPVLWGELTDAQPRQLAPTEKLLAATAKTYPDRPILAQALVYTRLLIGNEKGALAAARQLQAQQPADPRRGRLVFEAALAAGDAEAARQALTAFTPGAVAEPERQLMEARLNLLTGQIELARQTLAQLQHARPEDPYLNYYLGAAELLGAEATPNPEAAYLDAVTRVEKATLQAPNQALRVRASQALSAARGIVAGLKEQAQAEEASNQ